MNQKNTIIRYSKLSFLLIVVAISAFGLLFLQSTTGQSETIIAPVEHFEKVNPQATEVYQGIRKFYVYDDWGSELNHYAPTGWMGDVLDITMAENDTSTAYTGYHSIKTEYAPTGYGNKWAGVYWLHPEDNWGFWPSGYDISGAITLRFWVKGETGGEVLEFFAGGIAEPYADTLTKASTYTITLTSEWEEYIIDLEGEDLSRVAGGFGWATSWDSNPGGATFFLDDIHYEVAVNPGVEIAPGILAMRPDELVLSGDYSARSELSSSSPLVLNQSVPGSVLLGYDSELDSRNGGTLEINATFDVLPDMAEVKIMWDNETHPGLIGTVSGRTANITLDNTEIWSGICNIPNGSDYLAGINSPLSVLFQPNETNFIMRINVDSDTVWHIARIVIAAKVEDEVLKNAAGFAYGPFRQGQTPLLEYFPERQNIWDDLSIMSVFTDSVKTYTIDGTMEDFPRLAKLFGMKSLTGIWIDDDNATNLDQVDRVIEISNHTDGIIVGNEVLLNNYIPVNELTDWIDMVKNNVTVNVTYSDTKETWLNNPSLATHVDFILSNIYAVWADEPIETAINFTILAYEELVSAFPSMDVLIGETGWASDGRLDCTDANQSEFVMDWIKAIKEGELKGYFFEFFDEPWKDTLPIEPHWGIFFANRKPKDSARVYLDHLLALPINYTIFFDAPNPQTLPYGYENIVLSWSLYDQANYSIVLSLDGVDMVTTGNYSGYAVFNYDFPDALTEGTHNVRVNATNELGISTIHQVAIFCEDQLPPTIRHVVLAINGTSGDLVLTYDYEDPEGDPDQSTLRWYRNDILMDVYNDMMSVPAADLIVGDEWYVEITPYDGIEEAHLIRSVTVTIPPEEEEDKKIPGFPIYILLSVAAISVFVSIRKFKKQ